MCPGETSIKKAAHSFDHYPNNNFFLEVLDNCNHHEYIIEIIKFEIKLNRKNK